MASAEVKINRILNEVGCEANGSNPWDPQVHDPGVYDRVLRGGTLAAGETYMDGLWDCDRLDILTDRIAGVHSPMTKLGKLAIARAAVPGLVQNLQSPERARKNAEHHYNIGNELYQPMLGETMAYSCAYWETGAQNLDDAQTAKFDLICRKLGLEPGMSLLDIGCGWGGLLRHAVQKYDVKAVGITPASEQVRFIKDNAGEIEVRQQDWRDLQDETFDRIASVGMFEHVGPRNYRGFFNKARELLAPSGIFLLHTIGAPANRYFVDPWINKYIFPGGRIPSRQQITKKIGSFEVADWHEMGKNYDPTLMSWDANFQASWPEVSKTVNPDGSQRYDERFKRMWQYYLRTCAGSFRNGANQLFQVVLTDPATAESYAPVR